MPTVTEMLREGIHKHPAVMASPAPEGAAVRGLTEELTEVPPGERHLCTPEAPSCNWHIRPILLFLSSQPLAPTQEAPALPARGSGEVRWD